jgi:hypothetical protein
LLRANVKLLTEVAQLIGVVLEDPAVLRSQVLGLVLESVTAFGVVLGCLLEVFAPSL